MRRKRILVTGVSGSAGSYLVEYLLAEQSAYEIWGISRRTPHISLTDTDLIYRPCDLNDFHQVQQVVKEVQPDLLFHLAANADVRSSFDRPLELLQNNIMGTANLFEALRQEKCLPSFQLCSSSEVYGNVDVENVPIQESCPINPCNPYAVSKLTQDALGFTYYKAFGLPLIRTRAFGYINPRRSDLFATAFALQVARIEAGKQDVLIHGNLESIRTMLDVRDVVEAYWIASQKGKVGESYNIGSTVPIRVGDFLELLIKSSKVKIETKTDPKLLRPSDVTNQIPSVDKFTAATAWSPKYSLEESVEFLLEHCRSVVANEILSQK